MKKLIPVLFFLIILICYCAKPPIYNNKPIIAEVDLQGHRGARGLKPENTLPAFDEAVKYNMTTLEFDTVFTKDQNFILHHDLATSPDLCQTMAGEPIEEQEVKEMTVAELKKLDCGSKKNERFSEQQPVPKTAMPTLAEVFEHCARNYPANIRFNIEIKIEEGHQPERFKLIADAMLKIIEKYQVAGRTTLQSFNIDLLPYLKKRNKEVLISALYAPSYFQGAMMYMGGGSGYRKRLVADAKAAGAHILSPYYLAADAELIHLAHRENLQVVVWTVNDKKTMLKLLQLGLDGIISDYPDRLRAVYDKYKARQ